jgi:sugar lactone lactonase YvrE
MSTQRPEVVADGFGMIEAPRWHEGCLWFSDFSTRRVHRLGRSGAADTVAVVPGRPSGLGFRPDGSVLVVAMQTRELLRIEPATGALRTVADLSDHLAGIGNDMLIDARGRAYVGGMGFDLFRGDRPRQSRAGRARRTEVRRAGPPAPARDRRRLRQRRVAEPPGSAFYRTEGERTR